MRTSIPGVSAVLSALDIVVVPGVATILPCIVSEKCALRLKVASLVFHYYHAIGCDRTPDNMNYTQVLMTFFIEWEALIKLSNDTNPDMPHLSNNIPPIKWIESFKDCLFCTYGIRDFPLIYVIRYTVEIQDEASDPLQLGLYYGRSDSVLEEIIARLDNVNPLFKSDNASIYSMM